MPILVDHHPAALAMAERKVISGKEFIKAVIVGYEVASE
jgi:2-methylcitrate dehydratase PrpD